MGTGFLIRRWLAAFAIASLVLGASHLLRDRGLDHAVREGLLWGAISASVYTAALVYRWRRRCKVPAERNGVGITNSSG